MAATLPIALAVALIEPVSALASRHPAYLAPPGNSAVAQYLEVVPTAAGSKPPGASGMAHPLTGRTIARLGRLGADGRLLVTVVDATAQPGSGAAPGVAAHSGGRSGPSGSGSLSSKNDSFSSKNDSLSSANVSSPVASALAAATGQDAGGGTGIWLPIVMLGAVVVVVATIVRRRSGRGP
jgi:hypothetical protein